MTLASLNIDPELKAILYECLHAKDKIKQREDASYDEEINSFILKERMLRQKGEMQALKDDNQVYEEYNELMGFKKAIQAKEEEGQT